ncbi:pentapeptide repeat-containing protein [Candidatus Gracilibacteria bacterium]|nr:pentapeptide repeat-containing protein [Candidatus Gracilibacteria bacterium]
MKLNGQYIGRSFANQNLAGVELSGEFVDVDFSGANLVGARLNGKFIAANFADADLTNADCRDGLFVNTGEEAPASPDPSSILHSLLSIFRGKLACYG